MIVSKKLIIRLSRYKDTLKRLKSLGFIKIFSDNIADSVGVAPSQVRKDFSIFGIGGHRRGGYLINDLLNELNKILGDDIITKVIVVGAGNLGTALIKYDMFKKEGIQIVAGFDNDDKKINRVAETPIYKIDEMIAFIKEHNIQVAIITVPVAAAQSITDLLMHSGIKGILNFTPIRLRGNENTIVQNIYLQTELEALIYFVNASRLNKQDIIDLD